MIGMLSVFPCRRKVEIMHTHSLFTLLGERLMMHTNTVSITTYNTLYEVSDCLAVAHRHTAILQQRSNSDTL